jgi:ABC-type lipoprotein export system ATPase subunit/tRNA A-37 threonylcarbamoyl transferase component Bud32
MNSSALIPKLSQSFSNCTLASSDLDVVRCERVYKNRPRSIYFFRSAPTLPTDEELTRIHQDVVSPSYFQAQDSSRWNHFVVLVADDAGRDSAVFRSRQRKIETDKNYARKLVVFQSELNAFVDRSLTRTEPGAPADSVVNTWIQMLQAAGLAQIQGDTPRAQLVRDIRAGKINPETSPVAIRTVVAEPSAKDPEAHFIKTFEIRRFDTRKISGTFELGRVNLLRGPNGSGKTSLFEAIEHFLCGATYRSGGQSEELDAIATFPDGKPIRYKAQSNAAYQEKDLRWYGRTINRGNRLYEGFARFNFLNTDAAAHFARERDLPDLKDALSMVALGPDAAHTWNRTGEFEEDISKELATLNNSVAELNSRLETANARLGALQTVSPQVEAQRSILDDALQQLGWPQRRPASNEVEEAEWFKELAVLRVFVEASNRAGGQPSLVAINDAVAQITADLKQLTELDSRGNANVQRANELERRRGAQYQRSNALRRLEKYVRTGFAALRDSEIQCEKLSGELAQRLIAPPDLDLLRQLVTEVGGSDWTQVMFDDVLHQKIVTERQQLESTNRQRVEVEQQLRSAKALVSEIHRLGHQFADARPHATECPMCRTAMGMTELLTRLSQATAQSTPSVEFNTLSQAAADMRAKIDRWIAVQLTSTRLKTATLGAGRVTMKDLIEQSLRDQEALEQLQAQLSQLGSQLAALHKAGFEEQDHASLIARLRSEPDLEQHLDHIDLELVERLVQETDAAAVSLAVEENGLRQEVEAVAVGKSALCQKYRIAVANADETRKLIQTQLDTLTNLRGCLQRLPLSISRRGADDLRNLTANATKALKAVDDLNAQIQKERARNSEIKVLQAQISRDLDLEKKGKAESERLAAALRVLRDLRRNYSLDAGLSNFLMANLDAIQDIFSRIHVPHELRLSSLADFRMERIGSKKSVALTQVSTGQRAALVLSVFFALNLSLREGPPQMLIDDPIAHIDDLNALSFLDFLADVAESGKRQIFFATANEKLANLFQKKMEFLGSDLKIYDMPEARLASPTLPA